LKLRVRVNQCLLKLTLKYAFVSISKQNNEYISLNKQWLTKDFDTQMELLGFGAKWVNLCDDSFENRLAKCKMCLKECIG